MDVAAFNAQLPVLGVCYGAQLTAKLYGGRVEKSEKREYGRAFLNIEQADVLLDSITPKARFG